MSRFGRRRLFASAAGFAVAQVAAPALAQRRSGTHDPVVEHVTFSLPDLDPAHDGLRIAQLTDLHVGWTTRPETVAEAIRLANEEQPDVVALTGDYLNHSKRGVPLIGEQLGGLQAPTLVVLGNHDHWTDPEGAKKQFDRLGYAVLQNQNTTLTLRGAPFTVVGIDDRMTKNADVSKAFSGARKGSRLALAHVPATADDIAVRGERIACLSGHTHGGQIHLGGLTDCITRAVMDPYVRGAFDVGPVKLYVSRGVGNSGLKLRVDSPPEVTIVTLRRAEPA